MPVIKFHKREPAVSDGAIRKERFFTDNLVVNEAFKEQEVDGRDGCGDGRLVHEARHSRHGGG
jgi:hypothetical protein